MDDLGFQPDSTRLHAPDGGDIPAYAAPREVVLAASDDGAFAVLATREEVGITELAIQVNAGGTTVGYDARARQLALDGVATPTPPRGETREVPGGGALTSWGRGFYSVDSAGGDSVSFFDQGGHVEVATTLAAPEARG